MVYTHHHHPLSLAQLQPLWLQQLYYSLWSQTSSSKWKQISYKIKDNLILSCVQFIVWVLTIVNKDVKMYTCTEVISEFTPS